MTKITCGKYTCKYNQDPNSFTCHADEIGLDNEAVCFTYEKALVHKDTTEMKQ
jgi:hypothetical protein